MGGPVGGGRLARDGGLQVQVRVGTAFATAVVVACAGEQAARAPRTDQQLPAVPAADAARVEVGARRRRRRRREEPQGAFAAHLGEH